MEKRKSRISVSGLVMGFAVAVMLLALPCSSAEAKYQYSTQTKTLTKAGVYQIQQKEDERILFLFKPEQSGVYFVKATSQQEGLNDACVSLQRNSKRGFGVGGSGSDEAGTMLTCIIYCEKGTVCPITIGMGKYIGGAGDAVKSLECQYSLEIIRTGYRVQKLSTKKACTLTKKDYGIYETSDYQGHPYKVPIPAFMTFQATKTGYYRFYRKNLMGGMLTLLERTADGSINYVSTGYDADSMYKLKKGKKYILQTEGTYPSNKIMVQYAAKKRKIYLDYNYPWKNETWGCEYDVQRGSKLGVLLPPTPTENHFAPDGTTLRKKYKFLGWYTKKKGGKKITAKTKKCQKIKKLYAHWK